VMSMVGCHDDDDSEHDDGEDERVSADSETTTLTV